VGLVDALLAAFDGRVEHHAPWHLGHETDVMMHGNVDAGAVDKWLADRGFGWLTFIDNGRLFGTVMEGLDEPAHVYHLMARGISKGLAIAEDLQRRGISAADAAAVGDSLGDLEMASHVASSFWSATALRSRPSWRPPSHFLTSRCAPVHWALGGPRRPGSARKADSPVSA